MAVRFFVSASRKRLSVGLYASDPAAMERPHPLLLNLDEADTVDPAAPPLAFATWYAWTRISSRFDKRRNWQVWPTAKALGMTKQNSVVRYGLLLTPRWES
jgi:hypothetical protein